MGDGKIHTVYLVHDFYVNGSRIGTLDIEEDRIADFVDFGAHTFVVQGRMVVVPLSNVAAMVEQK